MLKRDISTTNILIASAGGMIGSGWLFSPFICAQMAGSNAPICWIIATIFMLFIALPLCELGTMFPVSGGMSNYPSYTHGKEVGFLYAWASWLSFVVLTPIEIQAILQYGSHFFPQLIDKSSTNFTLSAYGYAAAVVIMFIVVIINSYGVKLLAECSKFASIIKFILPSIAICMFMHVAPDFANVSFKVDKNTNWQGIFSALSIGGVAFAFTGFQNGLMLAGEIKNPGKNIPISLIGAILIGFILYFMLQIGFLVAIPKSFLANGWHALSYPGDSGPLVGLALLLGLGTVATLLMIDAVFSPFGTTFIVSAATSRIVYGMALNQHLPKVFLKVNKHNIPYVTLYANFAVGMLSFLPFPGWQKLVAFLSSACILSYSIGPVCMLAMRKLQPNTERPFKLIKHRFFAYSAFYICNLMLYWCGFEVLYKLDIALLIGLVIHMLYQRKFLRKCDKSLAWFSSYMLALLSLSYLGTFGGIGIIKFPFDLVCILPFSILFLYISKHSLGTQSDDTTKESFEELKDVTPLVIPSVTRDIIFGVRHKK